VIAAKAAERRRSRFVNIFDIPSTLEFVLKRVALLADRFGFEKFSAFRDG
jgi:hypothetical protein